MLHSALSDGERYDEWHRIRTGEARVVVGPRSAVFAPVRGLGLVVVDYLQLMQSDRRSDSRVLEVGDISRGLKLLAKDLGVPCICCAQLSRGPESRTDKRPMLSDLRDSGAIEQDADVVMFLYRNEYYANAPEGKDAVGGIDSAGTSQAECLVAKNRHGSTANVKLGFDGRYSRFTSIENREEP